MSAPLTFPILLERFFTERLIQQKHVSAHTIASYRDTFCLLLRYVSIPIQTGHQSDVKADSIPS
ncbi:hypothetical protein [Thiorhodococcus mannitoliphagus]|uniref:hypothetical protein n=1 Tax=Thiorhodococcus mannitoliphagus TaxID=329406 RepID=UPI001981F326|nr:hypothetical protein [Thiorhodococcus mannitoliphagus]